MLRLLRLIEVEAREVEAREVEPRVTVLGPVAL